MFTGALADIPEKVRRLLQSSGGFSVEVPPKLPIDPAVLVGDIRDPGFAYFSGRRWGYGASVIGAAGFAAVGISCPDDARFGLTVDRVVISVSATVVASVYVGGTTAINNTGEAVWLERITGGVAPVLTENTTAAIAGGLQFPLVRMTATAPFIMPVDWHVSPGGRLWIIASITGDLHVSYQGKVVLTEG